MAMSMRKLLASLVLFYGVGNQLALDAKPNMQTSLPLERAIRSRGSVRIDGRDIQYAATAGTLLQRDGSGRPVASVFYISYVARGLGPSDRRPITFAYNGGPGVSSTSLNVGAFGPKIVSGLYIDHRETPEHLTNNANSLLAKTDLVFIDAVGTGFSRLAASASGKGFYGVDEDANTFTQFIRRYTLLNARSKSPKYLLGLSYGTTRSAVVANDLERAGIEVSGIVLMSTALDFPAISGGAGQDLQFCLSLPTEAMIASYYGKIELPAANLDRFLSDVRAFAAGPYAETLEEGDALSEIERRRIAQRLHTYTGLSVADIMQANLRVSPARFAILLLSNRSETIGRYDGRVSASSITTSGQTSDTDPSTTAESAAFAAAVPSLLGDTLHYSRNDTYVLTSLDVNQQWDWGEAGPSGTNVTEDLAEAMTADPHLRILSLNGYYDLATPFFGTEYQLAHLGVSPAVRRQIAIKYYRSGHMIFVDPKARAEMKRDLDEFYAFEARTAGPK
jgi:carboxypeptidase C (cathepsin A)